MNRILRFFFISCAAALIAPSGASLFAFAKDPLWPCAQRKVDKLTVGLVWQGANKESLPEELWADPDVQSTASQLSEILLDQKEVERIIEEFDSRNRGKDDRKMRMSAMFLTVFDNLHYYRNRTMTRIAKAAKRQIELQESVDADFVEIKRMRKEGNTENETYVDLHGRYQWKLRAFKDRGDMLPHLCRRPVFHEKRIFFISRKIQKLIGEAS